MKDLVRANAKAPVAEPLGHGREVVNLRLAAVDPAPRLPPFPARASVEACAGPARLARAALGGAISGPTVLTELTATTVVPAHWRAQALCDGSLWLERQA